MRISDALRGIVFNELKGPNLVCAGRGCSSSQWFRPRSFGPVSFWADALIRRQDRVTQVWRDGHRLGAVGSARIRGGPRVWEIDHLYLGGARTEIGLQEEVYSELLDNLVHSARERGAERVFLKCLSESDVTCFARRAGFFHYFNQVLFEGDGEINRDRPSETPTGNGNPGQALIRARSLQDTHGLFQLFSAATPHQVRVGLGFTLDQWRDAQESSHGREWVSTHADRITGWAALWTHGQDSHGEVMTHPDHPELLPVMVGHVLDQPGQQKWLVPDYQVSTQELLAWRGFRATGEFAILAKTVAAQEFSHSMAVVEA